MTKIIPNLVPIEKCVPVPKEVCVSARVNPKKISKPVIKQWCGPRPEREGRNALLTMSLSTGVMDPVLVIQSKEGGDGENCTVAVPEDIVTENAGVVWFRLFLLDDYRVMKCWGSYSNQTTSSALPGEDCFIYDSRTSR